MSSLEYIAACEVASPNSPEFGAALKHAQKSAAAALKAVWLMETKALHNSSLIGDEVFLAAVDHINNFEME